MLTHKDLKDMSNEELRALIKVQQQEILDRLRRDDPQQFEDYMSQFVDEDEDIDDSWVDASNERYYAGLEERY